jgi:hypothetical protein
LYTCFLWGLCWSIIVFCLVFCRSFLSIFIWPLYWLSFNSWFLITPLTSSNFSYLY